MRYLILAAALLAAPAMAAEDPYLTGEALKKAVDAQCSAGCVVMTREDVESIQAALMMLAQQAFAEGTKQGKATCSRRDL